MFESQIVKEDLEKLNAKVKTAGYVDREHLMEFLTLIPTNDGQHIIQEVKTWLTTLHNDPSYDKVSFPGNDIDAIISDLDSYGRVSTQTLMEFKSNNGRTPVIS
jgi:putative heme iron utilization protein